MKKIKSDIQGKNLNFSDADVSNYVESIKEQNKRTKSLKSMFEKFEIEQYVQSVKKENEMHETLIENIKLSRKIGELQIENTKIEKAKQLITDYMTTLNNLKIENDSLKNENKKTNENDETLRNIIKRLPKFIRRIFIKEDNVKMLLEKN